MTYGYIAAMEIVVPASDMAKCFAQEIFPDVYDLDEIFTDVRVDVDDDGTPSFWVDGSGVLSADLTRRQSGRLSDIDTIEERYRLDYLQNVDMGRVDTPPLCSWEKTRQFSDGLFRFTYRDPNAVLTPRAVESVELLERIERQKQMIEEQGERISVLNNDQTVGMSALRGENERLGDQVNHLRAHLATVSDQLLALADSLSEGDEPVDRDYAKTVVSNLLNTIAG